MRMQAIREIIEGSPLSASTDAIMALVRPALKLHTKRVNLVDLRLGASRMAGPADLPAGMAWPTNGDRPLELLAQINLTDASRAFLPRSVPDSGWLVFFADIKALNSAERSGPELCHVAYFQAEAGELERKELPSQPFFELHACGVTFEREDCLPAVLDILRDFGPADDGPEPGLWDSIKNLVGVAPSHEKSAATVAWDFLESRLEASKDRPFHRMGGYGALIQSDQAEIDDLELLMQIDTDEEGPGWMWGDAGRLFFWIDPRDLARHAFDKAFFSEEYY